MESRQAPAARDGDVDPVYEWLDDGASYLLRLHLPEFKKDDLRVHVDAEGRLTVLGQRAPGAGAGAGAAKESRLHKVFQLPNTANLDAITARFDGAVLTLTVPKLPQSAGAVAPQTPPPPPPAPHTKEEAEVAEDKLAGQEDKAATAGREAETERRIEAERASLMVRGKEDEGERKPEAPLQQPPPSEKAKGDHRQDQDEKARADHREKVDREAARRIEAARARVAEAKAKAEQERKREHWKDRAVEEGLKWAEAVGKKKEVIATAVAAFTLGVFASHRLFGRN